MKITRLKIVKLFNQFDYDIPFYNPEGVKILTGPNGYGKTAILNIIDNIVNVNLAFFHKLPFDEICLCIEKDVEFKLSKNKGNDVIDLVMEKNKHFTAINFDTERLSEPVNGRMSIFIKTEEADTWFNINDRTTLTKAEVFDKYAERIVSDIKGHEIIKKVLQNTKIYFIQEQRLYKKIDNNEVNFNINKCQEQLKDKIKFYTDLSEEKRNKLDATFPTRLLEQTKSLTQEEYNKRFRDILKKQHKLQKYDLVDSTVSIPEYSEKGAQILSAYLDDTEERLAIYDDLIRKLGVFTDFIEKRIFTNKKIYITKRRGFVFRIKEESEAIGFKRARKSNFEGVTLSDLSSGEQHQIILLFELIFNLESGSVVLIDEPEISLHVAWMRMFISDLLEILKLQGAQAIVVTHSPQIIDVHSNLQYDLYAATQNKQEEVADAS